MYSQIYKIIFFFISFLIPFFISNIGIASALCAPFKVHREAQLPEPPQFSVPESLPENWEKTLTTSIGEIKTQNEFPEYYYNWLKLHPHELTESERFQWLNCLLYYVKLDTNQNGIPDWSAINDHQPSHVLFPEDPDQDGDGIPNVYDPEPLIKNRSNNRIDRIPAHLKFDQKKRPEAARLQELLYHKYRILAIDHTDQHSPTVLRKLVYLLEKGFSKKVISKLNIQFIYAFSSHDSNRNIASYHFKAHAISIGGISNFSENSLTPYLELKILSALAHEFGHAFLLEKISAKNLIEISSRFSDWNIKNDSEITDLLFSPVFFEPYASVQNRNIVSEYSKYNRHEWFAESFAAAVLNELKLFKFLNNIQKKELQKKSSENLEFWVDYSQISDDFRFWFNKQLRSKTKKL